LADLPLSYPAGASPTAENTRRNGTAGESTPKTTPHPAEAFAGCIRDHLDDAQLAELVQELTTAELLFYRTVTTPDGLCFAFSP
jgi:hypothetical protein